MISDQKQICWSMYIPNQDIEAHSRKYFYAFLVYGLVWTGMTMINFLAGSYMWAIVWTPFYWWFTLWFKPIQFKPYWEDPAWQKSFLEKGLPY